MAIYRISLTCFKPIRANPGAYTYSEDFQIFVLIPEPNNIHREYTYLDPKPLFMTRLNGGKTKYNKSFSSSRPLRYRYYKSTDQCSEVIKIVSAYEDVQTLVCLVLV